MSTEMVEYIHLRLKEELKRCGETLASAARSIGENSPQRLKDVVSGRQKCPAELVAKLVSVGIDPVYVLTGIYAREEEKPLSPDESILIEGYRRLSASAQRVALLEVLRMNSEKENDRSMKQKVSGSNNRVAGRDFITKE